MGARKLARAYDIQVSRTSLQWDSLRTVPNRSKQCGIARSKRFLGAAAGI